MESGSNEVGKGRKHCIFDVFPWFFIIFDDFRLGGWSGLRPAAEDIRRNIVGLYA